MVCLFVLLQMSRYEVRLDADLLEVIVAVGIKHVLHQCGVAFRRIAADGADVMIADNG